MSTTLQKSGLALAVLAAVCQVNAAVSWTITPTAISNTYAGTITLQISGLTNHETVVVQKYLDTDGGGVVDASAVLWQQFTLADGQASVFTNGATSVTNFNVPCDTDGSVNGSITAKLYPSLDFAQLVVGEYLFVLSSPVGHFSAMTNSFTVTNFPFAQSLTGSVVSNSTPVPYAVVLLFRPSGQGENPQTGAVANGSGAYTIKAPPGTYLLAGFRSNFVANLSVSPYVTLGAGATITTNIPMTNAITSISGNIDDANNPDIGLPAVLIPVQTSGGADSLLAIAWTDTNGNFTARVTPDQWKVEPSSDSLPLHGYLKAQNSIKVDTTTGSVSGVTIALSKGTAIFYGKVLDNLGNPLPGVGIYSSDNNGNYEGNGYSYTNGSYITPARGGLADDPWQVQYDESVLLAANYVFSQPAFDQNGGTNLNTGQAVPVNFTGILATNYITGNVQFLRTNVSGVGVSASATIGGLTYNTSVDTDTNGNYSLGVANGNWSVSLNCSGGNDSLDDILGAGVYQCPNNQTVTISDDNGTANFNIPPANGGLIFGYVADAYGNLLPNVNVYVSDGVGDNYATTTDGSGYYSFGVENGDWGISLDCGQLESLGYQCVGKNFAVISDDSIEVDFYNVPFLVLPTFPLAILHPFSATALDAISLSTNSDGFNPYGGLLLSSNTLYGTAAYGGTNGAGTVFAVNTNITILSFSVVHTFSAPMTNRIGNYTNGDGGVPEASLILSSNILYGTAAHAGTNGNGTVFAVNTNGVGFRVLHTFKALDAATQTTNSDGAEPYAGLILSGSTLYGTAYYAGTNGNGTVFAVGTNGVFSIVHTFTALDAATQTTNRDGANPYAGLILSGNTLYGTASDGGSSGYGTVFAVNTNGNGFTVLYSFTNGTDGAYPYGGLILSGNTLYGTASGGGNWGNGTVFAIGTNGMRFALLHTFTPLDAATETTNGDGATPVAALILSSNILYGAAIYGGGAGDGTVFAVSIGGTNFVVLHEFTGGDDGANPYAGLVLSGDMLYGTAEGGGANEDGTVFALAITPLPSAPAIFSPERLANGQFQMTVSGSAGQNYTVQMSTNLIVTNWFSLLVTNPASSSFLFTDPNATNQQRFYRILVGP